MPDAPPLQIVIVGHVDHGKSTLIGRLFYDTGRLPVEKYEAIRAACERDGRAFELAFLMDALEEERDQNVTIDTAQTYFRTALRKYVIIDAPGHKEFLKNMLTGAAQADAAVLLVDAEEGVREQTQRHAYVLGLLGIAQVIVAVNKMDRVAWSERRYEQVRSEATRFLQGLGITPAYSIPISARDGDGVARPSEAMPWYGGPTVLEALDTFAEVHSPTHLPLRYPIQDVYRWDGTRYYAGRVESGVVRVGDEVVIQPSGRRCRVRSIEIWNQPGRTSAEAGESVALTFDQELFAERGEVVAPADAAPSTAQEITANLFWLGTAPVTVGQTVQLKLATAATEATVAQIPERLDSSSLAVLERHAGALEPTEAGTVVLTLRKPLAVDLYDDNPRLGRFVVTVDGIVRGGGTVREVRTAGLTAVPRLNLGGLLLDTGEGLTVDLSERAGTFEVEAGEGLLARFEAGERVLVRLRTPEQVAGLTRLAYQHGLRYGFDRAEDGRVEILLSRARPVARRREEPEFSI